MSIESIQKQEKRDKNSSQHSQTMTLNGAFTDRVNVNTCSIDQLVSALCALLTFLSMDLPAIRNVTIKRRSSVKISSLSPLSNLSSPAASYLSRFNSCIELDDPCSPMSKLTI